MKRLPALAALAALALALPAVAQTKWDMPTAYPANNFHTENIQQFANDVDKATAGKLKITEVTTSNPNFVAALETVTPDQQYRVKVTFTPPTRKQAKQTESGEMIIHTDDPQEPTLRVQLVARAL